MTEKPIEEPTEEQAEEMPRRAPKRWIQDPIKGEVNLAPPVRRSAQNTQQMTGQVENLPSPTTGQQRQGGSTPDELATQHERQLGKGNIV